MTDGDRDKGESRHDEPEQPRTAEPDDEADGRRGDAAPPPREMGMAPVVIGHNPGPCGEARAVDLGDGLGTHASGLAPDHRCFSNHSAAAAASSAAPSESRVVPGISAVPLPLMRKSSDVVPGS